MVSKPHLERKDCSINEKNWKKQFDQLMKADKKLNTQIAECHYHIESIKRIPFNKSMFKQKKHSIKRNENKTQSQSMVPLVKKTTVILYDNPDSSRYSLPKLPQNQDNPILRKHIT